MAMHQVDRLQQIADYVRSAFFGEGLAAGDDVVELAVAAELHDRVEVVLVAEVAVIFDDVGVVEEALDLQLADELHQQVVF